MTTLQQRVAAIDGAKPQWLTDMCVAVIGGIAVFSAARDLASTNELLDSMEDLATELLAVLENAGRPID